MFSKRKGQNPLHLATLWYDERKGKGVFWVGKKEFSTARQYLGKTQSQMAQVLGVSLKAIQSFEQGWRNIPVHIERQVLFLLASKKSPPRKERPCWVIRKCLMEIRQNCPAWEFQVGNLCWFINGTICQGRTQESWQKKMKICRQCKVFQTMVPSLKTGLRL
jgi:hypothetical protein